MQVQLHDTSTAWDLVFWIVSLISEGSSLAQHSNQPAARVLQVVSSVIDGCNGGLDDILEKLTELSVASNASAQSGTPLQL